MGCLNRWDQQSKRLFSADGVMQTLYAGENAGGNTVGVVVRKRKKNNKIDTKGKHNERKKCS